MCFSEGFHIKIPAFTSYGICEMRMQGILEFMSTSKVPYQTANASWYVHVLGVCYKILYENFTMVANTTIPAILKIPSVEYLVAFNTKWNKRAY